MNRIVEIDIGGKKYPLNFSLAVANYVDDEFGGLDAVAQKLQESRSESCKLNAKLAAKMIEQGAEYFSLTSGEKREIIGEQEILTLVSLADYTNLADAVATAINKGVVREVEVKTAKKEKAAPGKPAAHGS